MYRYVQYVIPARILTSDNTKKTYSDNDHSWLYSAIRGSDSGMIWGQLKSKKAFALIQCGPWDIGLGIINHSY